MDVDAVLFLYAVLTTSLIMASIPASEPLQVELVEKAKRGQLLTFERVLDAKFNGSDRSQFDALREWAEKVSPEERAIYFTKVGNGPDDKSVWKDKLPCGQADRKGITRSMVVAVGNSPDTKTARRVWADAERAYVNALSIEAKNLIKAKAEASHRPTEIGRILAIRIASDQAFREAQSDQSYDDVTAESIMWRLWSKQCHADKDNSLYIKSVFSSGKWPIISRDGRDAARDAFLLVQHSDEDIEFQERVLTMLEPLVSRREADGKSYALLFDRVALARHRPQRYGSQFTSGKDGCLAAEPVEDREHIDVLRASVGLPPLREYVIRLRSVYKRKACDDLFATEKKLP